MLSALTCSTLRAQTADSGVWMRRADIRSIRTIANGIDGAVAAGRLRQRDTSFACDGGSVRFDVTAHVDSLGVIRRIHFEGGTDDSAHELWYYYDRAGRLRFAFAKRGAVNGTQEEERAYYDPRGTVLHRDVRRLDGPGYPWEPIDPIANPKAWLRNPCE
jgi:hypothetical protein